MSKQALRFLLSGMVMCLLLSASLWAKEEPDKDKTGKGARLQKVTGTPRWQLLNINNLTTWTAYTGDGNHTPSGDNGVYYPIGTGNVVYEDGLVMGGKIFLDAAKTQQPAQQQIRTNGNTYLGNNRVGTDAGWVTGSGASAVAASPNLDAVRVYRIRRDYASMSESEKKFDAQTYFELPSINDVTQAQVDQIMAWYAKDWTEWPTAYGAPYIERNGQPGYQAPPAFGTAFTVDSLISGNYDEPGVAGADNTTPADQVMFNNYNNLNPTIAPLQSGSLSIGTEIQKTVWAYKRTDAMGNTYFTRYRIINKGGVDIGGGTKGSFWIDSMYVCQWSDIDLGNAGDDLVGCDSARSLAYTYNANAVDNTFIKFNLPPPCSAYDFLAGALVSGAVSDSGIKDFKRVFGKKNQGMSSFAYFSAGSIYTDPPGGLANYLSGTGKWWAMLQGYAPVGVLGDPLQPYPTGPFPATKFPFSGDPVAGTGFLDGLATSYSFAPGDRRILLNTGPFTLAPGDTQDIYVGFVVGLGGDRLSSIALMKANDNAVQETFDLLFKVAKPPKNPTVKFTELDGQVILEWGSDVGTTKDTEGKVVEPGSYAFEGYNLYQFPSAGSTLSQGKRIATFDLNNGLKTISDNVFDPVVGQFVLKPVQYGTDIGVQHTYVLNRDYVRDIGKLYNGQEYYFAVTAYSVTPLTGYTKALESAPQIFTVVPKVPFGATLTTKFGDSVAVTKVGASDGKVVALVVDPLKLNGNAYRVNFAANNTWSVTNTTTSTTVASGLTNQAGDENYPVIDGVIVKVFGAPSDSKDFLHTAGPTGALATSYAAFTTFNSWGFPNASGVAALAVNGPGGPSIGDWGGGRWGVHTGGAGAAGDESYTGRFVPRVFRSSPYSGTSNFNRFVPNDYEIRFTAAGGKAYLAFTTGAVINVPFEIWCVGVNTPTDPSDDYRMIPWINDADANGAFNLQKTDHALSGGDNDPYTDWIYWMEPNPKTPGSAGYNAFVADATYDADVSGAFPWPAATGTGDEVMARVVLCNVNGGSVSDVTWPANVNSLMPANGNVIRIVSTKPNTPSVNFTYTTAGKTATTSSDLAKQSAGKVGVFPNPYYASNTAETNRFQKFVTFNNLPPKATIRVFNLAGQLVRTINKDNTSQFQRWNLLNDRNFPVASGIYVVYIDMPDVGATKTLKLAVIMEQEVLDIF